VGPGPGPKCVHASTRFGAKLVLSRIGAGLKGILSSKPSVCRRLNGNLGEPPEDSECLAFSLFPAPECRPFIGAGRRASRVPRYVPGAFFHTLSRRSPAENL